MRDIISREDKLIKSLIIIVTMIMVIGANVTTSYANDEDDEDVEKWINEDIVKEIQEENKSIEAGSSDEENTAETSTKLNENDKTTNVKKPILNSRRYVIFDRESKTAVYGKDENKQTAMASTTKIMTSLVVLENCKDLNEIVTIDTKSAGTGGSVLGLKKDDKISVRDLLYGLMLRSGNDTAVALALHIGGSIEGFAKLMNDKAQEIGLKDTHFVTPHGLDDPNHYTTAYELAYLTDYALKNETLARIVKTSYATITINGSQREIKNTNELLLAGTEGVYGVKTGFTNNAGRCLVTAVKRNDMDLIVVVLGADTRKDRAKDSLKLIDYAYKKYRVEDIESLAKEKFDLWNEINSNRIYINKGRKGIELEMAELEISKIVTDKEITVEINSLTYLEAPLQKGYKIGTVVIKNGEDIVEEVDIVLKKDIERKNVLDYFYMFAKVGT